MRNILKKRKPIVPEKHFDGYMACEDFSVNRNFYWEVIKKKLNSKDKWSTGNVFTFETLSKKIDYLLRAESEFGLPIMGNYIKDILITMYLFGKVDGLEQMRDSIQEYGVNEDCKYCEDKDNCEDYQGCGGYTKSFYIDLKDVFICLLVGLLGWIFLVSGFRF